LKGRRLNEEPTALDLEALKPRLVPNESSEAHSEWVM